MRIQLDQNLSVGALTLCLLVMASAIGLAYKSSLNKRDLDELPRAHQQLRPLPAGAFRTMQPPHEFRGECSTCHPTIGAKAAFGAIMPAPRGGIRSFRPMATPWPQPPVQTRQVARVQPPVPVQRPMAIQARPTPFPAAVIAPTLFPQRPALTTRQAVVAAAVVPKAPTANVRVKEIMSPRKQRAADKMMVEGHWLGMETMDLTQALRGIYQIPEGVMGVIIDEITLDSAESGILAGDVITSINGFPTPDLKAFFIATQQVSDLTHADAKVMRLGVARTFELTTRNAPTLGFAQMEGAQPILPGSISPHAQRSQACTSCHVIMATGGQLPVDAGDITPTPPLIAANAMPPHQPRGACNSCHQILK